MPFFNRTKIKLLTLLLVAFLLPQKGIANHIYGVDLYYAHVSGNTYTIYMAVYGDCSSSTFSNLSTSSPAIKIYNGSTLINTISLSIQAPASGVEVTPVCPAMVGHTTCSGSSYTIPGVKKFVYAGNVTLSGTSAVWRFVFAGSMGGSYTAGRISSITNLSYGTGTPPTIQLVDTLNNTAGANSSAIYTSIPTPFFCISTPANYNPAAVDPDGNTLSFDLEPGMDAATGAGVSYAWPYSATAPLGVVSGSFSFSGTSGQLSFTPNIVQKSLVVYNVRETSGGTLKGTSQREMCFIILSPCTNNPPTGSITSLTSGTVVSATQLNVCSSVDTFRFNLNPTDADGDTIDMSVSGLPSGANFIITNNGTTAPHGTFSWVASSAAPGTYTFYVTYQDHGCPLSTKQTIAYSVTILPTPSESVVVVSQATCTRKAVLHITPGGAYSPWFVNVLSGATSVHTFTGVTGMLTDSLLPGTYTIRAYNPVFCYKDTTIVLPAPALPNANITITPPICTGGATGIITVIGSEGGSPFLYALNTGSFSTSGTFTGRPSGIDTVHIVDSNGCHKDTIVTVPVTPPILENLIITKPLCRGVASGRVIINAYNSVAPYTYALGAGAFYSNDTFTNLAAGTYTFHIRNDVGCIDDTTITLTDSMYLHATVSIAGVLCHGGNATITMSGVGGYGGYTFALNTGSFSSSTVFTLPAGTDTFHITDNQSCTFDTALTITQPALLTATFIAHNISCNGLSNGNVVITAVGGTPGYRYAIDAGSYGIPATIGSLTAGAHTFYIKDTNGCIHADTFTIAMPAPVVIDSVGIQIPSCYLGTNGRISVYASGGTPGYAYAINSGAFGSAYSFSGLGAAGYTLHIKDANGCVKDTFVTLLQPAPIIPAASVTNSLCSTLANGKVILSASGGTPGYTFAVGSGSFTTSGNFYSLPAGAYIFHTKDANGCIKDTAITIINTLHISGIISITPERCNGDSTGIITITGTGGINPYTYAMGSASFSTANTYTGLGAGNYTIHIQDSNGCIGDTILSVSQPNAIAAILTISSPICYGQTNGSIMINGVGGTPSYTFSLNGSAFMYTVAFVGLAARTDTIKIKDANGCLYDTVVTITQPAPVSVSSISGTNISCNGGADGSVTIIGTGGTPAYLYAADGSFFLPGPILTGLPAGTHTIHVKDSHGCITDTTIILMAPPALVWNNIDFITPTCQGFKDGTVTLHASGGTAPYLFSKDNITYSTSPVFALLPAGAYSFYVKDAHNCINDTAFYLLGYPNILIDSINRQNPSCNGKSDAVIAVFPSGGIPPFTFSISSNTPQMAPGVFNNLHSGNYIITITDSKGCILDTTITLADPDTMVIFPLITPNDCNGNDNNGRAAISISGGNRPYTYLWSLGGGTDSVITGKANATYTVWVTDRNYCTDSAVLRIGYDDCCIPYIPNAFSPNNDGRNDVFRIKYKGDIRIIEFSVYNRYGDKVFTTSYSEDGWDGTYKGVMSDIGVYYYYVKLLCGDKHNNVQEFQGDVTLVR